jgi:hypothetical protein
MDLPPNLNGAQRLIGSERAYRMDWRGQRVKITFAPPAAAGEPQPSEEQQLARLTKVRRLRSALGPRFARCLGVGYIEGRAAMMDEWVDGTPGHVHLAEEDPEELRVQETVAERERFPRSRNVRIDFVQGVIHAVIECEANRLVNDDVKVSNTAVTPEGEVKTIDLEAICEAGHDNSHPFGTTGSIASESLKGQPTATSSRPALATLMAKVLVGVDIPVPEPATNDQTQTVTGDGPVLLPQLREACDDVDLPNYFADLLGALRRSDPEERADLHGLIEALEGYRLPPLRVRGQRPYHRWAMTAIRIAAVLLLMCVAGPALALAAQWISAWVADPPASVVDGQGEPAPRGTDDNGLVDITDPQDDGGVMEALPIASLPLDSPPGASGGGRSGDYNLDGIPTPPVAGKEVPRASNARARRVASVDEADEFCRGRIRAPGSTPTRGELFRDAGGEWYVRFGPKLVPLNGNELRKPTLVVCGGAS